MSGAADYSPAIVRAGLTDEELAEGSRLTRSDTLRLAKIRTGRMRRIIRKHFTYDAEGNRTDEEITEPPTFADSLKAIELSARIAHPELIEHKGAASIGPVIIMIQSPPIAVPTVAPEVIDVLPTPEPVALRIDAPGSRRTNDLDRA